MGNDLILNFKLLIMYVKIKILFFPYVFITNICAEPYCNLSTPWKTLLLISDVTRPTLPKNFTHKKYALCVCLPAAKVHINILDNSLKIDHQTNSSCLSYQLNTSLTSEPWSPGEDIRLSSKKCIGIQKHKHKCYTHTNTHTHTHTHTQTHTRTCIHAHTNTQTHTHTHTHTRNTHIPYTRHTHTHTHTHIHTHIHTHTHTYCVCVCECVCVCVCVWIYNINFLVFNY